MANESSGMSSIGNTLPDARKPLSTQRQQASITTDTALPVNKSQTLDATQSLQLQTPQAANESSTQPTPETPVENTALSADELREILDEINSTLYSMNKSLRFEVHEKTDDLIVRVVNTRTDKVIRQYPSEEVLERKERLLQGETSAFSARVD